jgi:hypothetical protein
MADTEATGGWAAGILVVATPVEATREEGAAAVAPMVGVVGDSRMKATMNVSAWRKSSILRTR